MTEGNMTGQPFGGANQRPDDDVLPGERPERDQVEAAPEQEPRAAQGGEMSRNPGETGGAVTRPDDPRIPDSGS